MAAEAHRANAGLPSGRARSRRFPDAAIPLINCEMAIVFIVQHESPGTEERAEDVKLIGAYSSEASARAAVERLRSQPGFRDYPDCFSVDAYEVDKDHWIEGFVTG